ncbi:MAG: bifunctional metallophosphatase/5'-nucleotidase [Acidobacteria bacterium]|nr:bifunctional metallophosphatase/5'-nucleotidase [Acidobacteriota bacterium]
MGTTRRLLAFVLLAILCLLARQAADAQSSAVVTILAFNDVYEIDAIEGGHFGGLSRVATVLKQLKRTRAPVLTMLSGDYLSPSAVGTAVLDGQPLGGRQVVDVLNAVGLDWATFGNHEFDVSQAGFLARNAQGTFHIVSSNVTDASGQLFPNTVRSAIVPVQAGGRLLHLGLIGLTLDANRQPWVRYAPAIESARAVLKELEGKVDGVIALTHQSLAEDARLVTQVKGIDLVLGGHEHENWLLRRGPDFTPIVKADANVRTVAIVTLTFPRPGVRPTVSTRFQLIDDRIAKDPKVESIARKWTAAAFDAFRKNGFTPERVVAVTSDPLDGRGSTVRNRQGRLTDLITAGIAREAGGVDVSIVNGGSVRIDDVIPPGPVTEYDVIRILPFGGKVARATFDGALLANVLDTGMKNQGIGGYLQTEGVKREGGQWLVQGKPLDPAARYRVAVTDFLLSGRETNLGFLTETNPAVHDVQYLRDVRMALIDELRAEYPARPY